MAHIGVIMFTTSTMQDAFEQSQKFFKSLPKTTEETKAFLEKVKNVYTKEAKKAADVIKTYQKVATGDASVNEIAIANKQAQSLMVTARFAALMAIPGAIFMIPALSKIEIELDADDIIPDSVRREFGI
jgi:hypothetical protein